MRTHGRLPAAVMTVIGFACSIGCMWSDPGGDGGRRSGADGSSGLATAATVPAGTPLAVRLATPLSSGTARVGDPWDGAVVSSVTIGSREIVTAGSTVRGVVTAVHEAQRGARAILALAVRDVAVESGTRDLRAAATGLVAASKGSQVILRPGTVMMFTVSEHVVVMTREVARRAFARRIALPGRDPGPVTPRAAVNACRPRAMADRGGRS